MSGVSYGFAFFLGTFLQCMMYGIFVCFFTIACYAQWAKFSNGQKVNRVMLIATIFFSFTITIDCALSLVRAIRGILYNPPGVTVYQSLDPPFRTEEIARWAVFELQIVVADIVMVYRMYHIYDKNPFVCVIPSITIAALFATGCGLTNQFRDLTTPANQIAGQNWSLACFCLTLFNCLFTTVAISLRLWFTHRETAVANIRVRGSIILRIIRVLIEGAALWTTFVVMNFIAFLAKSNFTYTFFAMISPAVGISFCLIIVRLSHILPQARDEPWHASVRTQPVPRTQGSDHATIQFAQVGDQRDTYTSEPREIAIEVLDSRKQGCVHSSGDPSKIIRASLNLSTSP